MFGMERSDRDEGICSDIDKPRAHLFQSMCTQPCGKYQEQYSITFKQPKQIIELSQGILLIHADIAAMEPADTKGSVYSFPLGYIMAPRLGPGYTGVQARTPARCSGFWAVRTGFCRAVRRTAGTVTEH